MNTRLLLMPVWLQRYLLATLAVIVTVLPVHAFISTWGGTTIGPMFIWKSWKELLLIPAVIVTAGWIISNRQVLALVIRDRLVQLAVLFAVIVLGYTVHGMATNGQDATLAGVAFDLRYVVMFVLAYLLARFSTVVTPELLQTIAKFIIGAGIVLAIVGILQVTVIPRDFLTNFGYEKFVTIAPYLTISEKSPDIIRAFATLRGPNDYGAYLVMSLAVTLVTIVTIRKKIAISTLLLIAIFASHSRSAYLATLAVIGIWLLTTIGVERLQKYWKYGVVAVIAVGLLVSLSLISPTARLIVFHSSDKDTRLTSGSNEDRATAIVDTTERIVDEPLGCGTGCSGPASYYGPSPQISENYYLQLAEQYGIVGLIVWLLLFVGIMRRLYGVHKSQPLALALYMSGIGLSIIGVLLHVWADDPLSMTWWALTGILLGITIKSKLK
ncbi:MAG: O-antigen ligase family protein [Candidatus Saccharimonadales bacterium]